MSKIKEKQPRPPAVRRAGPRRVKFPKSINLYKFIRLILGADIPDIAIAERWRINQKNFHQFKVGKYPVPRLGKLEQLATVLNINKHLVFQVASGTPAQRVFDLIQKNDFQGQVRLLSRQAAQTHQRSLQTAKLYRKLFNSANDAIFIMDPRKEVFIDCNNRAEQLTGYSRNEIIGLKHSALMPPDKRERYKNHFKRFVNGSGVKSGIKTRRMLRADGTTIPVSISSCIVEIDGQPMAQAICREINPAS